MMSCSTLRDLPPPGSLGDYSVLIAWAVTPQLRPVVKLGEVRDGSTRLGRIAFDRFLLLITAERQRRRRAARPLVLRGTSASVRMQPHDLAFLLAGLIDKQGCVGRRSRSRRGGRRRQRRQGRGRRRRCTPTVSMPPAFMSLRPDVSSYLPAADPAIPLARPRELVAARRRRDADARPPRRCGACCSAARSRCWASTASTPDRSSRCSEASTITVRFINRTDFPTAMHWHGLRLDNRFDGVPHVTQEPVPPGGSFDYRVLLSATRGSTGITRIIAKTCCRTSVSTAICSCGRASRSTSRPPIARKS